jgi:hypothetical protein
MSEDVMSTTTLKEFITILKNNSNNITSTKGYYLSNKKGQTLMAIIRENNKYVLFEYTYYSILDNCNIIKSRKIDNIAKMLKIIYGLCDRKTVYYFSDFN